MITGSNLRRALQALGETLADRCLRYHVAVIGGSALLLRNDLQRSTRDVGVVAVAEGLDTSTPQFALPAPLRDAAADVAAALALGDQDWLNSGAVAHVGDKLPDGYMERAQSIVYDALTVSVLSRQDLIRLKMYAVTDEGPDSQHARDLATMQTTIEEFAEALAWVRRNTTQDPHLINDIARRFGVGAWPQT